MRVIARCPFNDLEAGALRLAGDKWDCSEERARHLVALNLVAVAKEQPTEQPKKAALKKPKKKTE
jgi:hypothetical protein